jgi:hypothetical protein
MAAARPAFKNVRRFDSIVAILWHFLSAWRSRHDTGHVPPGTGVHRVSISMGKPAQHLIVDETENGWRNTGGPPGSWRCFHDELVVCCRIARTYRIESTVVLAFKSLNRSKHSVSGPSIRLRGPSPLQRTPGLSGFSESCSVASHRLRQFAQDITSLVKIGIPPIMDTILDNSYGKRRHPRYRSQLSQYAPGH